MLRLPGERGSLGTAYSVSLLMHCFLVVDLEKVVFREGNCQGNQNYELIQLNTLLERLYAEIKNKHS